MAVILLHSGHQHVSATHVPIYLQGGDSKNTKIIQMSLNHSGPGNSVGIATDYGLKGPGSNPGGDEIFRPSIPALGPTRPPVKWVKGLSRGKVQPRRAADHSPASSAAVMEE
jgi:hypothetical protein